MTAPTDAPFAAVSLSFAAYLAVLSHGPAFDSENGRCQMCGSYGYCYFPDRCGRKS